MRAIYLSLLCVCLLAAQATAVTVTVTPVTTTATGQNGIVENQLTNGWSIVTNRYGIGEISPRVPSLVEAPNGMNSKTDGSGVNFGSGTFFARCGYVGQGSTAGEDKTPSTVWLGCDQFGSRALAGIKLNQIKTLKYYTYVAKNPSRFQDGSSPDNWDSVFGWLFPSQPVMLQFTVGVPNCPAWLSPAYSRLQFEFRPWDGGYGVKGDPKNEDALGIWLEYNVLSGGKWMWSPLTSNGNLTAYNDWSTLLASPYNLDFGGGQTYSTTFGQCELLPTTTDYSGSSTSPGYKSPGWNGTTAPAGWPCTNGTGKTLNFTIGARMSTCKWPGEASATNWAHFESIGERAQMDYFTLGVDLNGDGDDADAGEQFTYNFEPAAGDVVKTDYISQKDTNRTHADSILANRQELHRFDNFFKVAGRVVNTGGTHGSSTPWMEINDGSGVTPSVRVYYARMYDILDPYRIGDYVTAQGFLEVPRWPWTVGTPTITLPYCLWTDQSRVTFIDPPL